LKKYKQLQADFHILTQQMNDTEIALTVYKSHNLKNVTEDKEYQISPELIEEQKRLNELFGVSTGNSVTLDNLSFGEDNQPDNGVVTDSIVERLQEARIRIQEMKSYDEGIKQKLLKIPSQTDMSSLTSSIIK